MSNDKKERVYDLGIGHFVGNWKLMKHILLGELSLGSFAAGIPAVGHREKLGELEIYDRY